MNYINTTTLEYPLTELAIKQANANVSFPVPFEPGDGYAAVQPAARPEFDLITERVDELVPEQVDGVWTQRWQVVTLPAEQAAANLAQAKAVKNAWINTSRLAANRGAFTHGGKSFACDELSRSDIDGITSFVTLAGSLPPGWPGAWKAVDNTYLPITSVAEWTAFVASMVSAGNANFAKAQALKAQLAAATTSEQINAIVW